MAFSVPLPSPVSYTPLVVNARLVRTLVFRTSIGPPSYPAGEGPARDVVPAPAQRREIEPRERRQDVDGDRQPLGAGDRGVVDQVRLLVDRDAAARHAEVRLAVVVGAVHRQLHVDR